MKITENTILVLCLMAMIGMMMIYFVVWTPTPASQTIRYDCGMAEWHPDVPAPVKEHCRQRYKQVT
jgi:hypothetical protein